LPRVYGVKRAPSFVLETTFRVGRREVDEDKGRMFVTKRGKRGETEKEKEGGWKMKRSDAE
jgi:hypothetical protein